MWIFHTPDFDKTGYERFPWVKWQEIPVINPVNHFLPPKEVQGMMMRIQAFDWLYAKGFQKVLYMDADTLVREDFRDIYKTRLSERFPLAACQDYVYTGDPLLGPLYERVSYEYAKRMVINRKYFNSGVIYIDLPMAYSKLALVGEVKMMDYFVQNAHRYLFPDQDLLNELYPTYIGLPRRFNAYSDIAIASYMTAAESLAARYRISQSTVIHYLARSKPWRLSAALDAVKAQAPIELYWEAMQPVLGLLDKNFVDAVKENMRRYKHIIDHARLTEDFLDE